LPEFYLQWINTTQKISGGQKQSKNHLKTEKMKTNKEKIEYLEKLILELYLFNQRMQILNKTWLNDDILSDKEFSPSGTEEGNSFLAKYYPFDRSFDELSLNTQKWTETSMASLLKRVTKLKKA
jgi:hypothetical protein